MSPALASRTLMRRSAFQLSASRTAARRFESSTASTAADKAKSAVSKTSEGLSRVTSAAGPVIAGAAKGVSNALGRVGGRTGRLIAFVERQVPFVIYYSKVGLEVGKIVFRGQKMTPPPLTSFQSCWQGLLKSVQNPSSLLRTVSKTAIQQPSSILQQVRNLSAAQIATGGVLLAETIGFFTVGEMLGRFKLVGYHGAGAHH